MRIWFVGLVVALFGLAAPSAMARPAAPAPQIVTSDVERFYQVYDAAHGHPTAADLQRLYLDQGSSGLHDFIAVRSLTARARNQTSWERPRAAMVKVRPSQQAV